MCVRNNLPMVALDIGEARIRTGDLLIANPASEPLSHRATLTKCNRLLCKNTINTATRRFVEDGHHYMLLSMWISL